MCTATVSITTRPRTRLVVARPDGAPGAERVRLRRGSGAPAVAE
jgi:hypothetical protein